MTTHAELTARQPKIPEPWLPEHFIEDDNTTLIGNMDLPGVLEELAKQLQVMNDYYYPLLAAAGQLRRLDEIVTANESAASSG